MNGLPPCSFRRLLRKRPLPGPPGPRGIPTVRCDADFPRKADGAAFQIGGALEPRMVQVDRHAAVQRDAMLGHLLAVELAQVVKAVHATASTSRTTARTWSGVLHSTRWPAFRAGLRQM